MGILNNTHCEEDILILGFKVGSKDWQEMRLERNRAVRACSTFYTTLQKSLLCHL